MRKAAVCAVGLVCCYFSVHAQDYKAYQNYDFVPGDKILFEDDFRGDRDGEFPAHWQLLAGQAVVNKMGGEPVLALTEGNYVRVAPRVKGDLKLPDAFTVEFDFFPKAEAYAYALVYLDTDDEKLVHFGVETSTQNFEHDLTGSFPGGDDKFLDKWHHLALAFQNDQMKCYIDQFRVLVMPHVGFKPKTIVLAGTASPEAPLIVANVRIASGGGMNLIDKLTTDGKVVTHGILFDVNQSTVKPPSMGTITEIAKALRANAAMKVEIGGHTDADGDAAKNLALSQARADAVKKLLVDQGVDASRLTAKGYGATKPIDTNTTPEGKANNRRVEFTKTS